jgi:NAD(P)-dependent dehydrogenase (short-subunit alcohol dehydrogenase family)
LTSALITGAGGGIGGAVARRLATEGFAVCVTGRRAEALERLADELEGLAIVADTSNPTEMEAAVEAALERFGRLDALVCAAGAGAPGAVADQTLERWNRVIATNLTGAFLACRAALTHLVATHGSVVTISSLGGLRAAPASAAYCASKAGLIMLTQSIALDYGPRGVRANCLCPGWIRTEMADAAMESLADESGTDREGAYRLAVAEVPARRAGTPEEVAAAVAWLVSPGAGYINGATITIDGGAAIVDAASLAFAEAPRPPGLRHQRTQETEYFDGDTERGMADD